MKSGSLFDDVLDPTATTAYTNQDVDESTESNVGQRLETGPAISQLSYPVGYYIIALSILGLTAVILVVWRFPLESSGHWSMEDLPPS